MSSAIQSCSRAQNNALSHLLTHFSIWPNTVQFGRTKFTIHFQWEPLTMCNNVTISNKWLIMTIFKINILSSAVEIFHYMCRQPSVTVQELKSNLLLIIALPRNIKNIAIDGQLCFYWWLIADPVKPPWCTTWSVGPVNGINKDVTGVRLLPTTVWTCLVDWVPFCHLLKTQHCYLCRYGRFNPPLAIQPSPITCHTKCAVRDGFWRDSHVYD